MANVSWLIWGKPGFRNDLQTISKLNGNQVFDCYYDSSNQIEWSFFIGSHFNFHFVKKLNNSMTFVPFNLRIFWESSSKYVRGKWTGVVRKIHKFKGRSFQLECQIQKRNTTLAKTTCYYFYNKTRFTLTFNFIVFTWLLLFFLVMWRSFWAL